MNRRNFITYGSSLAALPLLSKYAHASASSVKSKSVVFLFLGGGPTHIELTHANPSLKSEQRSVVGEIKSKIPGYFLGGLLPEIAKYSDKMNFVKSYGHTNANHQNATYWQFSGKQQNQLVQTEPSVGAIAAKIFGTNSLTNGIPTYLSISKTDGENASWLGSSYNPFEATEKGTRDLTLSISEEKLQKRLDILESLELKNSWDTDKELTKELRHRATDLILGNTKKAFEIKYESDRMRDLYGRNFIGDSLLLSRRLIQNGGRFININYGGWDMHGNIKSSLESRVPPMDKAIAAFIQDITSLGMEKDVLLIVTGEFGRTPKLNNGSPSGVGLPGRDHWAQLCTLFTFGGNYEQGRVIGKSDRLESVREESPFEPKDLAYTMLNHLGVESNSLTFTDNSGRPRYATEGGKLIL